MAVAVFRNPYTGTTMRVSGANIAVLTAWGWERLDDGPPGVPANPFPQYLSDSELAAALASKVNTSTYTAGLAGKADLAGGKVPDAQLPDRLSDTQLRAALVARPVSGLGTLTKWRAARARVQAGQGDAKILCVGDSTTAGVGADGTNPLYQGSPLAYPYQLAAILNAADLHAARGLGIPPPGVDTWDTRWNGAGWNIVPLGWGSKAAWEGNSNSSPMVYTDPVTADRFDVYYLKSGNAGSFTAQATGGSATTVNGTGAASVGKVTVAAATLAKTNTVTITPTEGGSTFIIGVEPWASTTSRVRVGNAGRGGALASDWAADPFDTYEFGSRAAIAAYAPDLTLISLGINDSGNDAATAAVLAAINTVAATAAVSGDVVLVLPIPSTEATTWGRHVAEYTAAQRTNGLPYFDTPQSFGSGDAAAARGRMWDGLHPNAGGYAELAQPLAGALLTA